MNHTTLVSICEIPALSFELTFHAEGVSNTAVEKVLKIQVV
jgi:hypothetical protein